MRAFVTGAAGFVGSNLVDRLLLEPNQVVGYDHLSTGREANLAGAMGDNVAGKFMLVKGDVLDLATLTWAMTGAEVVFHFAACADLSANLANIHKVYDQNVLGTFNVLEAARVNKVKKVVLASTGSVYCPDEAPDMREDDPLQATSLYAASKMAGEAMLQAYAHAFDMKAYIFRFVSMLGPRYSHGWVRNYLKALHKAPGEPLVMWGAEEDVQIEKAYVDVRDAAAAVLLGLAETATVNTFNVGLDYTTTQANNAQVLYQAVGRDNGVVWDASKETWVGDNPYILLNTYAIRSLGWTPKFTMDDAVKASVDYLTATFPEECGL